MTTRNQIVYAIINALEGGQPPNVMRHSPEQIAYTVDYYRALLLRRDLDRYGRQVDFEQDLGVVNLSDGPAPTIFQTPPIPTPVRLRYSLPLKVYDLEGLSVVQVIDYHQGPYLKYRAFTSGKPYAWYRSGKVYVNNPPSILDGVNIPADQVNVRGIFESPADVHAFMNPTAPLYTGDEPYPVTLDMVEAIVKGILSGEFRVQQGNASDKPSELMP